jgi:hypothetical protein
MMDGTVIRSAGDTIWWVLLEKSFKKKMTRLPLVIGNYYSHPSEQAEFCKLPHDELRQFAEVGASFL